MVTNSIINHTYFWCATEINPNLGGLTSSNTTDTFYTIANSIDTTDKDWFYFLTPLGERT